MIAIRTGHALVVLMFALALASPAAAEVTEAPPEPALAPAPVEPPPAEDAPDTPGPPVPAPQPAPEAEATPQPSVSVSDTRQAIWQTQVGCVSRCANTSQSQEAAQFSSTSQSGAQQQASDTQQEVRQTQVGCPAVCLGDDADVEAVYQAIVEAIYQDLPTGPLGDRLAAEVRSLLAPGLATEPVAVQEESTGELLENGGVAVVQVIAQAQVGCAVHCRGTTQEQHASQESRTFEAAGGFASVLQFIWQLQIGCIAFCQDTVQIQEAIQESYAVQGEPPAEPVPEPPTDPGSAPAQPTPPLPSELPQPPPPQPRPADTGAPPEPAPTAHIAPPTAPQSSPPQAAGPRSRGGRRQPASGRAAPARVAPRGRRRRFAPAHPEPPSIRALPAVAPPVAGAGARRSPASSDRPAGVEREVIMGAEPPRLSRIELGGGSTPELLADFLALMMFALVGGAVVAGVSRGARSRG